MNPAVEAETPEKAPADPPTLIKKDLRGIIVLATVIVAGAVFVNLTLAGAGEPRRLAVDAGQAFAALGVMSGVVIALVVHIDAVVGRIVKTQGPGVEPMRHDASRLKFALDAAHLIGAFALAIGVGAAVTAFARGNLSLALLPIVASAAIVVVTCVARYALDPASADLEQHVEYQEMRRIAARDALKWAILRHVVGDHAAGRRLRTVVENHASASGLSWALQVVRWLARRSTSTVVVVAIASVALNVLSYASLGSSLLWLGAVGSTCLVGWAVVAVAHLRALFHGHRFIPAFGAWVLVATAVDVIAQLGLNLVESPSLLAGVERTCMMLALFGSWFAAGVVVMRLVKGPLPRWMRRGAARTLGAHKAAVRDPSLAEAADSIAGVPLELRRDSNPRHGSLHSASVTTSATS